MEINDELIADYIDGTASDEERNLVREYLSQHPEEYEQIICIMDNDVEDYLGEQTNDNDCIILKNDKAYSDIAYSAAAFAPQQKYIPITKQKKDSNGVYDRLNKMIIEIENII